LRQCQEQPLWATQAFWFVNASQASAVPMQPPPKAHFVDVSHWDFVEPLQKLGRLTHVEVEKSVMHSGAFMQAVLVVYIEQFVVTVQVGAANPQPVCATHALIIVYVPQVVAVPAHRACPPSPALPSTPPSRTTAHEIVAPGARQNPSPSHVKPLGQSCGP